MNWISHLISSKASKIHTEPSEKKGVPEGIWHKCDSCSAVLYNAELTRNLFVCPKCDFHIGLNARQRLDIILDKTNRIELATEVLPVDRLKFKDSKKYKDRLLEAQKKTGEKDALVVMRGAILNLPVVMAAFEFAFIGGSMGAAVGEKFVRAVDAAKAERLPLIAFSASGGARMQEGLISLMQMAKTSAALAALAQQKIPYISILTNPTMGGVSASFAMLGDIIIAEPGALIGFAGPRVIEQTVRQTLPTCFQRSEFLLEHGAIDMIVARKDLRFTLARLLAKLLQQKAVRDDE